jgi:hypothetical protein
MHRGNRICRPGLRLSKLALLFLFDKVVAEKISAVFAQIDQTRGSK